MHLASSPSSSELTLSGPLNLELGKLGQGRSEVELGTRNLEICVRELM